MNRQKLLQKLNSMTQRLDHFVPKENLPDSMNRQAMLELEQISSKLYFLLPDPSLSPLERIERLSRVLEDTDPNLEHLQSAYDKVKAIEERLNSLIPDKDMSSMDKINFMLEKLHKLVPGEAKIVQKLEYLGDPRVPKEAGVDLSPNLNALAT
jgi:hypothetical protein